MQSSVWTEQAIEALIKFNNNGYSSAAIAKEINNLLGTNFTRNSIIGKKNRMGLCATTTVVTERKRKPKKPKLPRYTPSKIVPPQPPVLRIVETPTAPLLLKQSELDNSFEQCRWPVHSPAEPSNTLFCGLPTMKGISWCRHHAERCFNFEYRQTQRNFQSRG